MAQVHEFSFIAALAVLAVVVTLALVFVKKKLLKKTI